MDDVQKKLITLLNEIDDICKKHKLTYFLTHDIALAAYRSGKFEGPVTHIPILMPLNDVLKLRKILSQTRHDNRILDSLYDNDHYPNLTFRYSDTDSLCINLREDPNTGFEGHGLYIKICILRNKEKNLTRKTMRFMEYGWSRYRFNKKPAQLMKKVAFVSGKFFISRHREGYRKKLISLFEKTQEHVDYSSRLLYRKSDGSVKKFPAGMFNNRSKIEFYGRKYPVPENIQRFLRVLYGKDWETHSLNGKTVHENFILDANLPFKVFFDDAESTEDYANVWRAIAKEKRAKAKVTVAAKRVNRAWKYVQRSGARINLYQEYMPLKRKILIANQNEDWEKLDELLSDYDEAMRKFKKDKMVIYFDTEIFNVYIEWLRHNDEKSFADKIIRRVPERHLEPIILTSERSEE